MITKNDRKELEEIIGMPEAHAQAFRTVAMEQQSIIMSRATGVTCHGLLEEGYDTKGFRIHGKSCDWGPMAGFVMRDPRLSKKGLGKDEKGTEWAVKNRKEHQTALKDGNNAGWKASTTPLLISSKRIRWLKQKGYIVIQPDGKGKWTGIAHHSSNNGNIRLKYALIKQPNDLWGLYIDNSDPNMRFIQEGGHPPKYYIYSTYRDRYSALLAMTNSPEHKSYPASSHLNAITGDYDLFAIWPYAKGKGPKRYNSKYNPRGFHGMDYRPLGTVKGHGPNKGNIFNLEDNFAIKKHEQRGDFRGKRWVQGTNPLKVVLLNGSIPCND